MLEPINPGRVYVASLSLSLNVGCSEMCEGQIWLLCREALQIDEGTYKLETFVNLIT